MKKTIKNKNNLQETRTSQELTQEELANKVNVSIQTIQSIEKGKYKPSDSLALNIATSLGKKVTDIFSEN
ncbi:MULTISPECIES: helix-turn-helix transcriptional regulator [Enterococcus]|uniref:helix-turn-helix transcriptional regulator n=1 Tax=Enterococcus TaxID=1350 RepID=UPI001A90F8CA|nr:helix-turn-helix transcriptional regulator [Enterococcus ureilyticus]MBO0445265.1 helix-turn-helix transcriptional regulator [Enterococcus ureilyticus]